MRDEDATEAVQEDVWSAVKDPQPGKSPWAVRVWKDDKEVRAVRLELDVTYIGRMPENHVVLDDPKASRSHARVRVEDGKFVLEDQESENGTFVGSRRVAKHLLSVGDMIQIGSHTLEVIVAQTDVKPAIRESQLVEAEEEEWRLDQTVSLTGEDLQKRHLQQMKEKKEREKVPLPVMSFSIKVGGHEVTKEFIFENPKKRDASAAKGNHLEVRLSIGQWIMTKKIPL